MKKTLLMLIGWSLSGGAQDPMPLRDAVHLALDKNKSVEGSVAARGALGRIDEGHDQRGGPAHPNGRDRRRDPVLLYYDTLLDAEQFNATSQAMRSTQADLEVTGDNGLKGLSSRGAGVMLLVVRKECHIYGSRETSEDSSSRPVKVDSKHYTVEFENDQVRVLRIKYGARDKSVMHSHPNGVGVFLTETHVKFTL